MAAKLTEAITGINRYADHGAAELRGRLAEWIGVNADQVTVGCGSVGLLQQLLLTYVDPGDEVIYPWRSFEVYPVFTQLVAGVDITTELVDEAFDLDAVVAAVTPKTKLILLANPNNPTGTALPMSDYRKLLEQVPNDVMVTIDEAYREFMDPSLGDPVADLLPDFPNLVVLRTFSKAQGLAALRVGYATASPEVIQTIDKTLFPFAVNGLAQIGAMASIDAHDEVMERVSQIKAERDRVAGVLRGRGYTIPESQANFVWLALGDRSDDVYLELETAGVVTRLFPGEGIRVTMSTSEENDRFLAAL